MSSINLFESHEYPVVLLSLKSLIDLWVSWVPLVSLTLIVPLVSLSLMSPISLVKSHESH